jgi:hypothetical protein
MNIQSEAGSMNKHEEILSKYVSPRHGVLTKENALKAMRELEESFAARTEGDGEGQKDFALFLQDQTEIIREEKITLYRYHDNLDGWGNYTLDDIYEVYKSKS